VNLDWETFQKPFTLAVGQKCGSNVKHQKISARKALLSVRQKGSTASAKKAINSVLNKD
jgi:hypothetical protein